jgi:hypothetical protein
MKILKFLLFIPVILCLSCSTPGGKKDFYDGSIQTYQIYSLLVINQIVPNEGYISTDETYNLPKYNWVKTIFSNEIRAEFSPWELGINDCDDTSLAAQHFARRYNYKYSPLRQNGIAFGQFFYKTDLGIYHAINFFIYREQENFKVGFYDAQTGQIIELSEAERSSCIFWII